MITKKQIQSRINSEVINKEKGWQDRVDSLKTCQKYLDFNPSDSYIRSERDKVKLKIERREKAYELPSNFDKLMSSVLKKHKQDHDKEYGTDVLRRQLEALNILLNEPVEEPA